MLPRLAQKAFFRALLSLDGSIRPMRTKLMMLKIVPRISPLAIGLAPNTIRMTAAPMQNNIAREQYFFWISLISVILVIMAIIAFFAIGRQSLHDVLVGQVGPADNTQYNKYN